MSLQTPLQGCVMSHPFLYNSKVCHVLVLTLHTTHICVACYMPVLTMTWLLVPSRLAWVFQKQHSLKSSHRMVQTNKKKPTTTKNSRNIHSVDIMHVADASWDAFLLTTMPFEISFFFVLTAHCIRHYQLKSLLGCKIMSVLFIMADLWVHS